MFGQDSSDEQSVNQKSHREDDQTSASDKVSMPSSKIYIFQKCMFINFQDFSLKLSFPHRSSDFEDCLYLFEKFDLFVTH